MLVRLSLVLIVLFFVAILLIAAQPEEHTDLEALLVPPAGCEMPCFLGIRIGETDAYEAIDILRAHPWVGEVRTSDVVNRQTRSVRFLWSSEAPPFLFSFRDNVLELQYRSEIIDGVSLHFHAPTGDIWRVLNTHHAHDGRLLSEYIRVDGPDCLYNTKAFYTATPERIYYRLPPNEHPFPYLPKRERPPIIHCD